MLDEKMYFFVWDGVNLFLFFRSKEKAHKTTAWVHHYFWHSTATFSSVTIREYPRVRQVHPSGSYLQVSYIDNATATPSYIHQLQREEKKKRQNQVCAKVQNPSFSIADIHNTKLQDNLRKNDQKVSREYTTFDVWSYLDWELELTSSHFKPASSCFFACNAQLPLASVLITRRDG